MWYWCDYKPADIRMHMIPVMIIHNYGLGNMKNTMPEKEQRYRLGLPEMDAQHDYCYVLFESIEPVFVSSDSEKQKRLIQEIEHYVMFHCECEEHLMRIYAMPGFAVHQSDHERMQQKLVQFLDDYEAGNLKPAALSIFLTGWLMEHSRISDSEYVRWIREKRAECIPKSDDSPSR
jgi:hemerythrin-like metal-binding protein